MKRTSAAVLVLFSAAAFTKPPKRWATEMSKLGVLPYYRGRMYRMSRSRVMLFVVLGLVAGTIYLSCYLRLIPTSAYTDALFHTASLGVAAYGVPTHVLALIIGNRLADLAIGGPRTPFR